MSNPLRPRQTPDKPIDERYPYPVSCECCSKCWYSPKLRRCIHGGPFAGYYVKDDK